MASKLLAICILLSVSGISFSRNILNVKVAVDCNSPHSLILMAKNEGDAFKVHESQLPWNSKVLALEAFSIAKGNATRLSRVGTVADYFNDVTFAPMQSRTGKVDLNRKFLNFDKAVEGDVILFFEIKPGVAHDVGFTGGKGVVFMPRKSFFAESCPSVMYNSL